MEATPRLRSEGKAKEYRKQGALSWLFVALQAGCIIALLFLLLLQPVSVSGPSMQPTLNPGEILLIDRLALYLKLPARGDMVIFPHPETGEELIKRVIAFPGETVKIQDGCIYVQGRALDESSYLPGPGPDGAMEAAVVPEGCLFVLGDNRMESFDSRDAAFGCIPLSELDGLVRLRIAPFDRINLFL